MTKKSFFTCVLIFSAGLIFTATSGCGIRYNIIDYYYPLKVGNEWEYEFVRLEEDKTESHRFKTLITHKQELDSGMVQYFNQKEKAFRLKSEKEILTPSGISLLKYPLTTGQQWVSGKDNLDKRLYRVVETNLSKTVQGRTYNKCIKIIITSQFHPIFIDGKPRQLAFESHEYYAPGTGLILSEGYKILSEGYDVDQSGEKINTYRRELVRFREKQNVPEFTIQQDEPPGLIKLKSSFGFPEKGFLHPRLSPDEKWIVFQTHRGVWKKLFYSRPDKHEKNIVPFFPPGHKKAIERLSSTGSWSPDGKILAVAYEEEAGGAKISLVDFSGREPGFMEAVTDCSDSASVVWSSEKTFLYLDRLGNIMKKTVGVVSEPAVFFRSTYKEPDYARSFQAADDGTIIYRNRKGIYLTSLDSPDRIIPVVYETRNEQYDPLNLTMKSSCILSPGGDYAAFYIPYPAASKDRYSNEQPVTVVDLREMKLIDKFSSRQYKQIQWSPDGKKLAYLGGPFFDSSRKISLNPHFYVLDVSTGDRHDFGLSVSDGYLWTPDGQHIIYSMKYAHESQGSYESGIFIMRVRDGQEIGKLTNINAHGSLYVSDNLNYVVWEGLNLDTFFVVENSFAENLRQ